MPTYDYICKNCHSDFEIFHSIHEEARSHCPVCKQETLERRISPGAGIIFKGSGYYVTDSKAKIAKKPTEKEKKTATEKQNSTDNTASKSTKTPPTT